MSSLKTDSLVCPECEKQFEITIYESINVSVHPLLKEKVLNGEIFEAKCPICNNTYDICYDCLYHDMGKKFFIWFAPNDNKEIRESLNKSINLAKMVTASTYIYRVTFDINSFIEKIKILDLGLNDKVVEICKVLAYSMFIRDNPEIRVDEIRFFSSDKEHYLAFSLLSDGEYIESVGMNEETYKRMFNAFIAHPLSSEDMQNITVDFDWALQPKVLDFVKSCSYNEEKNNKEELPELDIRALCYETEENVIKKQKEYAQDMEKYIKKKVFAELKKEDSLRKYLSDINLQKVSESLTGLYSNAILDNEIAESMDIFIQAPTVNNAINLLRKNPNLASVFKQHSHKS